MAYFSLNTLSTFATSTMRSLTKAFLGALAIGTSASGLIAIDGQSARADSPMTQFDISAKEIGAITFSGAGTSLYNQQEGTSNSVNAGTNSNLSFSTSLATSPNYGGSATVTVTSLTAGKMSQGIGIKNTGAAGVTNSIDGVFKATIDTSSVNNGTKSTVDIQGLMNEASTDASGAGIALSTGIVNNSSAPLNGSATASASINSGTTANAAISTNDFASGFMQSFQPTGGLKSIQYSNGDVETDIDSNDQEG
jgi:hypothetical protein